MLQGIINFLYRNPKSYLNKIKSYGGFRSYYAMNLNKKGMQKESLLLSPLQSYPDGLPIYFLTGRKYFYQTLFCIKSLYSVSSEKFCIHLIDDGSFDQQLIERANKQIPNAVIVLEQQVQNLIVKLLPEKEFPVLNQKRIEYIHIRKLIDIHLLEAHSFKLVLDSDMIFWKEPTEMINWLKNPSLPIHMVDCMRSYGYPIEFLSELANDFVPDLVNVGIIGLESKRINWVVLEGWIIALEKAFGKSYYLEQAISAMLIGSNNSTVLSKEEYIVNPSIRKINSNSGTLHHYVDTSKKGYFNLNWGKIVD